MDYTTHVIIANEKLIVKIKSGKELAHRIDHNKPK